MSRVARQLRSAARVYVEYTIFGKSGTTRNESLLLKALGQAKYLPFYSFLLVGSTVALVMGVTGFIFTGALIYFEGVSSFSDTGLLASGIVTGLGAAIKLGIYYYIRQKERKLRMFQEALKAFSGIREAFIDAFAKELRKEQGQLVNNLTQSHPEALQAMQSYVAKNLPR